MAALVVMVALGLLLAAWLMTPLAAALTPALEGHLLPWVLLLLAVWLLAGRPADSP